MTGVTQCNEKGMGEEREGRAGRVVSEAAELGECCASDVLRWPGGLFILLSLHMNSFHCHNHVLGTSGEEERRRGFLVFNFVVTFAQ